MGNNMSRRPGKDNKSVIRLEMTSEQWRKMLGRLHSIRNPSASDWTNSRAGDSAFYVENALHAAREQADKHAADARVQKEALDEQQIRQASHSV